MKYHHQGFCAQLKPVIFILLVSIIVGTLRSTYSIAAITGITHNSYILNHQIVHLTSIVFSNVFFAVLAVFYPVSGFVADTTKSRYRVISTGVSLLWCSLVAGLISTVPSALNLYVLEGVMAVSALVILIIGLSCYSSNIIQFGFDQLLDVPSHYLSMFVHWYVWSDLLGGFVSATLNNVNQCYKDHYASTKFQPGFPAFIGVLLFLLTVQILVGLFCNRRRMFNTTPTQSNPYKLIYRVLKFTWKNKYRVGIPKAAIYCDRNIPVRMDYAKDRFGGPFEDSDIEDVKTFLRLLYTLITLVPVFMLELPVSDVVFSIFTLHSGTAASSHNTSCSVQWVLLGGGGLSYCASVIFLPVYIYLMFSVFRNRIPKMFVRIGIFSFLLIIAVTSMMVVDLTGHLILHVQNKTDVDCMLVQSIIPSLVDVPTETLNLHWSFLIFPNLFIGIAPNLLLASILEFISAQTPHTMKGLMVGVLFALRGLSRLFSAFLIVPFSLSFWTDYQTAVPGVTCATGYFLVVVIIAMIGFIWFVVSACKYTYRVRDEDGFRPYDVEEVVDRELRERERQQRRFPLLVEMPSPDFEDSDSDDTSTLVESPQGKRYGAIPKNE